MISILIEWSHETNWLLFTLPPFGIWFSCGIFLLGFAPILKRASLEKDFVQLTKLVIERAFHYKLELLFTALSLTILTYIYNILLVLGNDLLPVFPDNLASTVGFVLLLVVFMAKLGKIARNPPSHSFVKSVKYIYGGFSDPFEDYETYKIFEEEI